MPETDSSMVGTLKKDKQREVPQRKGRFYTTAD